MKKYVCPVCGYVHEGDLPEGFKCPVCGVDGSKFKLMEDNAGLAAEHVFGIGAMSARVKAEMSARIPASFPDSGRFPVYTGKDACFSAQNAVKYKQESQ